MAYIYSQLREDVNNRLHNKIGRVSSPRNSINRGVQSLVSLPLATLTRRYSEPVRIVDGVTGYYCPTDLQGSKVIDVRPVTEGRSNLYGWRNTHPESFDRLKSQDQPVLCVASDGPLRFLKLSSSVGDTHVVLSELDSITDGGTWAAVGTASNLATDTSTYLYGSGSVRFDLGAGVKDGIDVTLSSKADITAYRPDGSIYLSASFPSLPTGVTVRLGSDSSNYVECTATSDISGNAITTGFNMFRMKLSDGTETGTPDYANIGYVALLVDKSATPMVGVRFDRLLVASGSQHYIEYYSKYGWRSASGAWKPDSTLDTDILNAEEEEYNLIVEACVEQVALAAREYQDATYAANRLASLKLDYKANHIDRSIPMSSDVWLKES